jgi:hypothetical protein
MEDDVWILSHPGFALVNPTLWNQDIYKGGNVQCIRMLYAIFNDTDEVYVGRSIFGTMNS